MKQGAAFDKALEYLESYRRMLQVIATTDGWEKNLGVSIRRARPWRSSQVGRAATRREAA